jgi:hypothetical protein
LSAIGDRGQKGNRDSLNCGGSSPAEHRRRTRAKTNNLSKPNAKRKSRRIAQVPNQDLAALSRVPMEQGTDSLNQRPSIASSGFVSHLEKQNLIGTHVHYCGNCGAAKSHVDKPMLQRERL